MKKMTKRILSFILALCLVLALVPATAQTAHAVDPVTSALIGQMVSRCMSACAFALSSVADASQSETFQDTAAQINKWVFGVSDSSAQFEALSAQMTQMCDEIISEMKNVENNLTTKLANLSAMIAGFVNTTAYTDYTEAWDKDVESILEVDNYNLVLDDFQRYLLHANGAVNQEYITENGQTYIPTQATAQEAKEDMLQNLRIMSGENWSSDTGKTMNEYYDYVLFETNNIDLKVQAVIKQLYGALTSSINGSRFIDRAAQLAYNYFPYSSEQAEFVEAAAQKQAYELYTSILFYQEFLGMRAEYFQTLVSNAKGDTATLEDLHSEGMKSLSSLSSDAGKAVNNWMDSKLYITGTGDSYLYLSQYLREDISRTLVNTSFRETYDYDFYYDESSADRVAYAIATSYDIGILETQKSAYTSTAQVIQENVTFAQRGIVVANPGGQASIVPIFLLRDETEDQSNSAMTVLEKKVEGMYPAYVPTADYYNLSQGTYSDGFKTYSAITSADTLKSLFNNNYLALSGSTLAGYLASDLTPAKTNLYLVTGLDTAAGMTYTKYSYFNMTSTDTWALTTVDNETDTDIQAHQDSSAFTFLMAGSSTTYVKLDTALKGTGEATVSVSGGDYDSATGQITAGTTAQVTVTLADHVGLKSVALNYHADASDPDSVTGTKLLLDSAASQCLTEVDGAVTFSFQVPYCDFTLAVTTGDDHSYENGICAECGFYEPASGSNYGTFYEISNAGQLCWFAAMVNGDTSKAEFTEQNTTAFGQIVAAIDLADVGDAWVPIGTVDTPFNGGFDGAFYPITNINGMLFGTAYGASISNVAIESGVFLHDEDYALSSTNTSATAGSIVGRLEESDLVNSSSKATFSGSDSACNIGGLVGDSIGGYIYDSYYAGSIEGEGNKIGGIVGNDIGSYMANCHVCATLPEDAGGLVGASLETEYYAWIENSYFNSDLFDGNYTGNTHVGEDPAAKDSDAFTQGEVAYLLANSDSSTGNWGQTIGTDMYPVLNGETVYITSNCDGNEAYSNTEGETVHGYTVSSVVEPTCTEQGYTLYTCTCGETMKDLYKDATGHAYSSLVTAPTCTSPGYTTYTCIYCGDVYTDSYVDATGHSFVDGSCEDCGEKDPAYDKDYIAGWNLSLLGDIGVNFYVDLTEAEAENAVMNITVAGVTTSQAATSVSQEYGTDDYIFTTRVAAAQMTDEIALELVVDGQTVATNTYTVLQYAQYILADAGYPEVTHNLVKAMLNYGGASQTYFDYNTDAMANEDITVESAAMPDDISAPTVTGEVSGISFYAASLLHKSNTTLRYYFQVTGDAGSYAVSFESGGVSDGKTYSLTEKGDGIYYVDIPDIAPQDLANSMILSVSDGTNTLSVSYSTINYIVRMYTASSNDALKDLLQAMYDYHLAASSFAAA